jgi:uncharacterized protein YndB with AHSA1/START domain
MKETPFEIEQTYNASVERVWKAITDVDQMRQWYFKLEEFKPEVGFEFRFEGGKDDDVYLHICTITEVVPQKKLTHTWTYDGYEGLSYVTWELFPEGDKTRVKLTHTGLESFPQNDPNFRRESFAGGWTYITGTSLKKYLEK